ncbi:MAG: hypothetical protein NTU88_11230 [Armatimonadetes bacterium]|nr:hypothetical protein [Armatimonadota bacterium]
MKRLTMVIGLLATLLLLGGVVDSGGAGTPEIPGKIAYIRDGNIWVAKANGDNPQKLTTTGDCSDASWSPDGTKIAYIRIRGENSGYGDCGYLWCYDLTTKKALRILPDGYCENPQWSPDGKWIAFCVNLEALLKADAPPWGSVRLEICSASGKNRRTVIKETPNLGFTWSPDAKRIYYAKYTGDLSCGVAFLELSDPSRSQMIYKAKLGENPDSRIGALQFLNEQDVAFFEFDFNDMDERVTRLVTLNARTREFKKEVLRPTTPNCESASACFLGDAKAFWLWEYDWKEGKQPLLTLVVNGKNVKTIEGEQVSWVPERSSAVADDE